LGYDKHYRALVDCRTIVTADRVRLGCYGVNGGKAGEPFRVTVDVAGASRELGGLVDGEPVRVGEIVAVVTTGGGGWGDPLEREPERVLRDVQEGKVSLAAARDEYGVSLRTIPDDEYELDAEGTAKLRQELRGRRAVALPTIDRGEGYSRMLREQDANAAAKV